MTDLSALDAAGRRRSPATTPGHHAGPPAAQQGDVVPSRSAHRRRDRGRHSAHRSGPPRGQPFAFAGLWTTATSKDSKEPITSCSIITTAANHDVRFVHDRIPVILNGSDAEAAWLDRDVDLEGALELVWRLPAGLPEVYGVSARVKDPAEQALS